MTADEALSVEVDVHRRLEAAQEVEALVAELLARPLGGLDEAAKPFLVLDRLAPRSSVSRKSSLFPKTHGQPSSRSSSTHSSGCGPPWATSPRETIRSTSRCSTSASAARNATALPCMSERRATRTGGAYEQRQGVRRAPSRLRLEHVAPQRNLSEHASDRARFVTPDQVGADVGRVACRMEAAAALRSRNRMRSVAVRACGKRRLLRRPHEVVQDGAEHDPLPRLAHRPDAPADDGAGELSERGAVDHFAAIAA